MMSRGALERRIAELALQRDLYHRLYEKERTESALVREWGAAHYQEALALRAELQTHNEKDPT